jgi:ribonucleoside-diphosphate reductase beta chain
VTGERSPARDRRREARRDDAPITDVIADMDTPLIDYRDLYYRWEVEQWEAGKLDLSEDKRAWRKLGREQQRAMSRNISMLRLSGETDALVSFADAVPTEEQQVFLTSQLADQARRAVFLDRYAAEVMDGEAGDRRDEFLRDQLENVSRRLKSGPQVDALAEGIALYHLLFLGAVTPARQRFIVDHLHREHLLPALRRGVTAMARDQVRHVSFGVRFVHDVTTQQPRLKAALRKVVDTAVAAGALRTDLDLEVGALPDGSGDPESWAEDFLKMRLARAGLGAQGKALG